MKQPDRFERIATKAASDGYSSGAWVISIRDAADLLRKEHAWMRRMVSKKSAFAEEMDLSKQGLRDLVLEQLSQRRK